MSRKEYEYSPDYAVCPGETIRGAIEALGITQKEFAARLGCSERHLIALLDGRAAIVQRMAAKLEKVTGTPARVWMNLEINYRQTFLRLDEPQKSGEPEESIALVYIASRTNFQN